MSINLSHKVLISLEIEQFFKEMPDTPEKLAIFINDMGAALQNHEKNDFAKLVRLFEQPEYFYQLDQVERLSKGEVRRYIIESIDNKINRTARETGTDVSKLGWDKETILTITKRNDDDDNLICQKTDPPQEVKIFINLKAYLDSPYFQERSDNILSKEIIKNIDFQPQDGEKEIQEPAILTLNDLEKIRESLSITEPTYIHSSIDSVENTIIPNIFNKNALNDIIKNLPNEYSIFKKYFEQLHSNLSDIDEALTFFHTKRIPCAALAISLAIAEKENLDKLKESVLSVISNLQIQDDVKKAFISHGVLDIRLFAEREKNKVEKAKSNQVSFFITDAVSSANSSAKIKFLLPLIKNGHNFSENEKGPGKLMFARLSLNELELLLKNLNEPGMKNVKNKSDIIKKIQEKIDIERNNSTTASAFGKKVGP